MKKYHIKTFGCQMNLSDSERIAAILEKNGYQQASSAKEADLLILNTCSVRQQAEDRIYGEVKKWKAYKKKNPFFLGAITGCVPAKDGDKFKKRVPAADIIFNIQDIKKLPALIKNKTKNNFTTGPHRADQCIDYLSVKPKYSSQISAYVPISIGCNNFCSYCAVPYARGREISKPAKQIIQECQELITAGYKEIFLLGQNVNSYGNDNKKEITFPKLLNKIASLPGDFWLRFLSSHPKDMSDELIKIMAKNYPKITPYIHFAVQSGSDKILKAMNRNYTKRHFLSLIKKLRQYVPDIMISTDIIVGFPGETEKDFKETVDLFKRARFNMAYIARYSSRPGTVSAKMPDNVPTTIKKSRFIRLTSLLSKIALEENKKDLNKSQRILLETKKGNYYLGKNAYYKTVKIAKTQRAIGEFVTVKITKALPWGLVAKEK